LTVNLLASPDRHQTIGGHRFCNEEFAMAKTKTSIENGDGEAGSPRDTMRRLPAWLQPLITEITGKAADEPQPFRWNWWQRLILAVAVLFAGTFASVVAVNWAGWYWILLPTGWLLTTSALRAFQTTFLHHASHQNLSGVGWIDSAIGDILSTVAWINPFQEYGAGHRHHHSKLALWEDVDLRFIVLLMRFKTGLTRRDYWLQLIRLILSPAFHLTFLWTRTTANLVHATPPRRLFSLAFAIAVFTPTIAYGLWTELVLVWLIPATLLYQISGVLQVLTEHSWVREPALVGQPKDQFARLTVGRFLGAPLPTCGLRKRSDVFKWLYWFANMAGAVAVRLFVLPGDLPSHDLHHSQSKSDWANAPYARRAAVAKSIGSKKKMIREVWGLRVAIENTFDALASLPTHAQLGHPLTYAEKHDGYLSM